MKEGYMCEIYNSAPTITLYEWIQSACEEIVKRNNIDPLNIGIIINSSIGLYETTAKKNTSAPGIGYHVQKSLNANNAFVFELFHNDWGNMLQISSNFMSRTEYDYSLVLQTNKFTNTLKDYDNGFSIPDGISIMLIKKSHGSLKLKNYPLAICKKASFEFNAKNKDLLQQDILFRLQWDYDHNSIKEINKQLNEIVESLQKKEIAIVTDCWFREHGDADSTKLTLHNSEQNALAMHTIPWNIKRDFDYYGRLDSYAMVSFNPFSSYYSVLKISKNEN
ncbi:hypothetical protein D1632_10285 [Chryseobacterium nematophagum]|uniref:Uncharacterized protein n=1 Tax=Chryseobacterium nematophagum TaxID=2305228 RepID=A0A3M7LEM3_9FLAO|nr:hypothetical protein [Chryseobacterium nematophagum]RMZ59976.1 hypothetical protein D1632_10285 [Chryseobacterium nematophagum]